MVGIRTIPDNFKAAVIETPRYEPVLNETYADLLEHCGAEGFPARYKKPRDKASSRDAGAGNRSGSAPGPKAMGLGRYFRPFGGGSTMTPSRCMASMAIRATMSLRAAVGLEPADAPAELLGQDGSGRTSCQSPRAN